MRQAAFWFLVGFGSVQCISFVDCCCGLLCLKKGFCTGCGDEATGTGGTDPAGAKPVDSGCCNNSQGSALRPLDGHKNEKRCVHFEPSTEVAWQTVEMPTAPWASSGLPALHVTSLPSSPSVETASPEVVPRPPRNFPLYLLNSVLLI